MWPTVAGAPLDEGTKYTTYVGDVLASRPSPAVVYAWRVFFSVKMFRLSAVMFVCSVFSTKTFHLSAVMFFGELQKKHDRLVPRTDFRTVTFL